MATIRELRKSYTGVGDLVWRAQAAEILKQKGIDIMSLITHLKTQVSKELLVEH